MPASRNTVLLRSLLVLSMLGLADGCKSRPFAKAQRQADGASAVTPSGEESARPAAGGQGDSRRELDELLSIQ